MRASEIERLTAAQIARGVMRLMIAMDIAPLQEVGLKSGRRPDILGLSRDGSLTAIEIKSSRADFMSDGKWHEYLDHADFFFFAVAPDFPTHILPEAEGLILADAYGGELVRPSVKRPLPPARRRALTLRFARLAAMRAQLLEDPEGRAWEGI